MVFVLRLLIIFCFLRENSERDQQCQQARHDQAVAQLQQTHLQALSSARQQADDALSQLRESKDAAVQKSSERIAELEKELSETHSAKKEAEYTVRKLKGEVEKSTAESEFYQTSHKDTAAMLRTRDQEVATLERDLAKVIAKKEALESQIVDKEEILQKASSLRDAAEQGRQNALEQVDLYKTGLASAQEKLQTAVGEIRRGNEAIQQLQNDVQACRSKLQSKNEVIRKQEALVQELRTRVAEISRKESKLRDDLALGVQKRELLERELKTAQASISEGAEIIQKNQEVISHLNEMINSLQLGGGAGAGMSSWASPVQPPRPEQQPPQHGHFSYQSSDQLASPVPDVDNQYSSPPQGSSKLTEELARSHQHNKYVNKVSPDSVADYGGHHQDDNSFNRSRHRSSTSYQTSQRFSLSPQHLQSNMDESSGGSHQKGYYDGVLDPRHLEPSAKSLQHKTHSPSTDYIAGITRSNRNKPAAYSWQLDDFGREGE